MLSANQQALSVGIHDAANPERFVDAAAVIRGRRVYAVAYLGRKAFDAVGFIARQSIGSNRREILPLGK
ncbi:MAG TPA: hypothetical protein PKA95_08905 [Thermomicrobiales bacterium]|nr:hypothetical protein [Thermomicrobiales bacterium]